MAYSDSDSLHVSPTFFEHEGWLDGRFLVATPSVKGDAFAQSVVYFFSHNEQGAMGVIINKPMELAQSTSLFNQVAKSLNGYIDDLIVYHGGPVDTHRGFVLHSPDYAQADTIQSDSGICVTVNAKALRDIAAGGGPRQRVMMIGYAGWAAGQLEAEIEANSWITVSATPELLFHTADDVKWATAARSLGVDMVRYSPVVGHA